MSDLLLLCQYGSPGYPLGAGDLELHQDEAAEASSSRGKGSHVLQDFKPETQPSGLSLVTRR